MILVSTRSAKAGFHSPVLLPEVISGLKVKPGRKYIDATLGGGGYTDGILKRGGKVLAIDRDEEAIEYVKKILRDRDIKIIGEKEDKLLNIIVSEYPNLFLIKGNFADLKRIANRFGFRRVAGIIFDLGMSSFQLESSARGFSWQKDEPLDMRMDVSRERSAADVINTYNKDELYEIFSTYSEELHSRAIAAAVFRSRSLKGRLERTGQLVSIVDSVLKPIYSNLTEREYLKIRNSTLSRIFQALRIVVNDELNNLKEGLSDCVELLEAEGRLLVVSFNSLEDRIVKLMFKQKSQFGVVRVITKDPIRPEKEEIEVNPRSHSAFLRIAEKI